MSYEGAALSSLTLKREFKNTLDALRVYQQHFEKFENPTLDRKIFSILKDELATDQAKRLKPIFR
jgi:hypothetical protein